MKRILIAALALSLLGAASAQAHVTLATKESAPGAFYRGVLGVPHGCDKSATTRITVRIPESVIGVKPMPKAGWDLTFTKGKYASTYNFIHGMKMSEGVTEITWTGKLPDDLYEEFVFTSYIADTGTDRTLYFPVTQTCEKGVEEWKEIPAANQSAHGLKFPAPAVVVKTGAAAEPAHKFHTGAIELETPWLRETAPGMAVAGGFLKVTNTGAASDKLLGGTLEGADTVEVHEMSMTDGVMKMRKLNDGLTIDAGKSVELTPGGYHLMVMGLKNQLKAGQTIKGTLQFEKAGAVNVTYEIRALSGGGMEHHH